MTYKVRLVRVDVPDEGLERSRFLREANVKYLDLVGRYVLFSEFQFSARGTDTRSGRTYGAPYGADQ